MVKRQKLTLQPAARKRQTVSRSSMSSQSSSTSQRSEETSSQSSSTATDVPRNAGGDRATPTEIMTTQVTAETKNGLLTPSIQGHSHHGIAANKDLIQFQPADVFPVFKTGDVVIRSELGASSITFQLHSSVLLRHSPWFEKAIIPQTSSNTDKSPAWHLFELENIDGKVVLVRHNTEGERPNMSRSNTAQTIHSVEIKVENAAEDMNNKTTNTLVAYTQLLGTFYSIPPLISTTEISTALVQAEGLVQRATELGCLHLIRSHVGNVLSEHRQKLFVAIKDDPIRWVQLAIPLEKRSIYTEALVHLIGAYPKWRKSPCYTALPEYLLLMIVQKTKELRKLRTEIERDMLLTTLRYGPNRAPLDPTEREQTETWITVQIFRDQLAQRIYKLDRDSNGAGIFFRELHKRTLEALDIENVREMCQGTMHSDWKELNADLKDLKDYVGELVEDLARNELMIEPDAHGVGYLTCAKIDDKDIPWSATVES